MGNIDNQVPYELTSVTFPEGTYIVADAQALAVLSGTTGDSALTGVNTVTAALDQPIPREVVSGASIVVVQADPTSTASMQRIVDLRSARPFMPLIVALENADLRTTRSLIREGVNDVVPLPFDRDQLIASLLDASVGAERTARQDRPLSPLYTVVGGIGGSGATTIATHLAAHIAGVESASCCLLDLDVQFGTAAAYLGAKGGRSVQDLLEAHDRLDPDLMRSVASEPRENLPVISAPPEILPLEQIELDQVLQVIRCARQTYGSVVLDVPTNLTNWSLSAILDSSVVLLVVELSLTSLRQARRRLDLFVEMGMERSNVMAVVNRVERGLFKTIKLDDAERALKVPVAAAIANEPAVVGPAQDQGLLASDLQARNAFSRDIAKLGEALIHADRGA